MSPGFCTMRVVSFDLVGVGCPSTHSGMIKSAERGCGGGLAQPSIVAAQTATQQAPSALAQVTTMTSKVVGKQQATQAQSGHAFNSVSARRL